MDPVTRLGVVGCGLMGSGIAEVAARSGLDVRFTEATPDALAAGRRRLTASLDRGVKRGKLREQERDQALARLSFTHDLSDLADRQTLRRYCPPTSKNASVTCFKEQTRAASMRTAKTFSPCMAASLSRSRAAAASSECPAWNFSTRASWDCFSS